MAVVIRMFTLPALIFWTVLGLRSDSLASRSCVIFRAIRSRRTHIWASRPRLHYYSAPGLPASRALIALGLAGCGLKENQATSCPGIAA